MDSMSLEMKKYNDEVEMAVKRVMSGASISDKEVWKEIENEKGVD